MTKKTRTAWYKLFSIMMVLFMFAGLVVPVTPAIAYAEGEDDFLDSPDLTTGFADTSLDVPLESEIEVESETTSVPVTGVSIDQGDQELEIGDTVQLTAVVEPEDATDKSVTWSSSNEDVATVDETGLVTAVAEGEAEITVTTNDGGFTDSITVTVVPPSDFVVVDGVLVEYRGAGGDVVIPGDLGITEIGKEAFREKGTLTSVVIPEGVTIIGESAFRKCTNLAAIELPDSLLRIERTAFYQCNSLTEVTLPENLEWLAFATFDFCENLQSLTILSVDVFINSPIAYIPLPSLTIYGYSGSTAETYANSKGIPFVALDAKPHIVSIIPVDDVQVPCGTLEADAIAALASETTIMDSDGATHTVALEWTIADYDGNTPGAYTATGTFELPAGVEQSDPPLELKVTATVTVLAQAKYAVTLTVDPVESGSASGAGEYAEGESVTVEAQAAEGYLFVNWTDGDTEVSTDSSYTFTMPAENVSLTANFEKVALEITGEGVTNPVKFTMTQLEGMGQYRHLYSTINTYPTKKWYVAEGVKLRDLLELAEITGDAKQLRFVSRDGFKATFTVKELLDDTRYLFPHFKDNDEYAGYIPGSPEDAEPVEAILALRSGEGTNFDNMNSGSALHLIFGQRWLTEQTNAVFSKYVTKVEVITEDPGQWPVPTADVASGEVPMGTLVKLSSTSNDTDKVHYTLDGSEPTVESPMYNWIAQRWSSRPDFHEINHPIEITEDTTIKAIVIGPGRYDSDIVTFEYMVMEETVPVTGVSITEGNQELEVGETVQLTAVVEPEDATDKSVTWSSDNEAVATVDETGLVTAVSAGEATIAVTTVDGGYSDSIVVNVTSVSDFVVENGVLVAYHGAGGDLFIPDDLNITSIGDNVFKDRSGLTSVIIPEGVTSIGKNAFDNCSNLHTVSLPESVVNIDNYAFIRCSSLSAVTIPENVTYIGNNAFNGCRSLTEITIPGSVGTISMGTFDNCSGLETVTILEGVTIIDSHAFRNCSGLTSITLPENLVNIGSNAFNGCSSLDGVILPDSLESMGIGAFRKCSSLVTIAIPAKLTIIPVYAFEGCTSLAEVIISEGVTRINSWAFDNCSSLSKMVIPRSVTHIAGFAGCDQLTIHGYRDSYAETYANDNGIPFVALDAYNLLSVEAEPNSIPIGDSFTVSVNVEDIFDVQGYEVTLKYDPAYAEYKSCQVPFKPDNMALEVIEEGKITVANFVLGDAPWEQDSGALVEIEFESRYPGTIEGGVYAFTFEEIEVVLEPRDSSDPAVREKLDSPVVRYYEGSDVDIYAALELREDHGGISSTLQNGSAYEATTGSDGSATFEAVRPGEYSLALEADGYLKAVVEGVVVTFGGENQVGTADVPVKLYVGDVNGDGKINIVDISLAANRYGQTGDFGWVIEDLNLDGKVNISDLAAIARNYEMTTADTTYNYKDEAPYWE